MGLTVIVFDAVKVIVISLKSVSAKVISISESVIRVALAAKSAVH